MFKLIFLYFHCGSCKQWRVTMELLTRKGPIILREGGLVQTDGGYIEILLYKHKYLFEIALLLFKSLQCIATYV